MSKLDWETFRAQIVRSLFIAVSSLLVVCNGAAHASSREIKVDFSESSVIDLSQDRSQGRSQGLSQTLLLSDLAPMTEGPSARVKFTQRSLRKPLSSEPATLISRMDRQNTPAVDLTVQGEPNRRPAEPRPEARPENRDDNTVVQRNETDGSFCPEYLQTLDEEDVRLPLADGLHVPSRFGASYSTSSAGFDDILGVHGFIPLDQDACDDLTFFEGNVQLHDGNLGFGLNVGHRNYDLDDNEIDGGYLGLDSRSTEASTFYQLAAGYEHIEDDWELRVNGYLPLGDRTRTIQNIDNDTGIQASSGFAGNELVLSAVGERQRIFQQENALGGFDVEVGTQLDEWYGGELMGFVGAYLLSGEDSSWGGQARLETNFESNFNAGLSYQYDDIFGSSLGFSVRASLPGRRFHDSGERSLQEENEVVIRLRDPIVRRPNVPINVVNNTEIIAVDETSPLRNPEEEADYRFIHVDLAGGAGTGDGTYESPFGSVEDAIALISGDADTYSDGNTVVYVDGENAPATSIPGFAIPDRVRVLSQGPEQMIAGMSFPGFPTTATRLPFSADQNFNVSSDDPNANGITVSLPDSNDGVFPTITGGANADLVTMGNNTVLAGFDISGATNHGVTATEVSNVELRNNRITGSGGSGIAFDNVGGNIVLFDNVINNSADRGIQISNSLTERPVEVDIAGFDLNNNQVGMEFVAVGTTTEFPSQRVVVGPSSMANTSLGTPGGTTLTNSILNSTDEGIILQATGSPTTLLTSDTQELTISDITIDGSGTASGAAGIRVSTFDGAHSQEFALENSTVTNGGGNGLTIINGENPGGSTRTAAAQEIVVRNSTISNNAGNGIDVTLVDAGAQELVIRGNQITGNTGDGIRSIAQVVGVQEWRTDATNGDAGISENTISGNGGQAIVLELEDVASIPIASIIDNDLSGNGAGPDIEITSSATPGGSAAACLVISDNLAPMGIQLTAPDPILTGNVASILVEDLPALLADSNITFLASPQILSSNTDPFTEESNNCIP